MCVIMGMGRKKDRHPGKKCAPVWKPGVFGAFSQRLLKEGLLLENEKLRNGRSGAPWKEWDTPLYRYSVPIRTSEGTFSFDQYLEKMIVGKDSFFIIDVGFGSGRQWGGFLKKHPKIEFWGTSLSMDKVAPSMKKRAIVCSAGAIGSVFPANHADFVASHFGFHCEADLFAIALARILKENGEAAITSRKKEADIFMDAALKAGLRTVGVESEGGNDPRLTVHLLKMMALPTGIHRN